MTVDYVDFHAAERPDATAVIHNGRAISFPLFSRDIRKVMGALRALGLARGGSVAVGTDDLYMHWLLLLASERLGIAAVSFLRGEERSTPLRASVDLVLGAPEYSAAGARRHHVLTPSWIEDVLGRPEEDVTALPAKAPDDPVRIVRTSGTTGESKRFLVTRRMHESLTASWQWGFALTPRSRYLQTVSLTVRATYDLGSACLRAGGTLVLESRMNALPAIAAHAITHAILLPVHLKGELELLPGDFPKPRDLTIVSFGAGISAALREKAMARLTTALCDLYGTVEVGSVSTSWRDTDGFGTLWPQVQAEAVDEHDRSVPPGEMGRIRLKTDYMSLGYLDDPETTARKFHDGWFYPGDVGTIRPGGQLKILGRVDDLLNIGGQKLLPAVLEEELLKEGVAGDVGVSSITGADGMEELCIAVSNVVLDDKEATDRMLRALRMALFGRFHAVKLERIPRSANGKLQRKLLREEIARVIGAGSRSA